MNSRTQDKESKQETKSFYDDMSNGIKIKTRCNWYESG